MRPCTNLGTVFLFKFWKLHGSVWWTSELLCYGELTPVFETKTYFWSDQNAQAMEHWKLEYQLLQMKHEKLKERSPMTDNAEKPFEVDAKADDIKQASSFMEFPI